MLGRLGEKTGGGGGETSQRRDDATVGNDDVNNTSGGSAVSDGKCSGLISVLHAPSHIMGPFLVQWYMTLTDTGLTEIMGLTEKTATTELFM